MTAAFTRERAEVHRLLRQMRRERYKRWRDALPTTWKERPGVVYHWLQAAGAPWGTTPILRDDGSQCCTPPEVDTAVRGFWVDQVLRQHADINNTAAWDAFIGSRFGTHIPTTTWPRSP
jgi:hypothetical protein